MGKPRTWKDFLKPQAAVTDRMGHKWEKVASNKPKKKFIITRVNGYKYAEVSSEPEIIKYICSRCQIPATNYNDEGIKPVSEEDYNLTCDQILVRNIIS